MLSIKDLWSSFFSLRLNKSHVRVRGRIVTLKNPTLYNNAITFENDRRFIEFITKPYNPIEIGILAYMLFENLIKLVFTTKNN